MEIVLGIDNIVFISILTAKLPKEQQPKARSLGLTLALGTRLGLLFAISWMMRLTEPLFGVLGQSFSGRDLILLVGGIFLVGKAVYEIHDKLEVEHESDKPVRAASFGVILTQILLLDVVFSLDSVITAVGMAEDIGVMVAAVIIAVGFMMLSASRVSEFVSAHPTVKMLALSFLLLIGMSLIAEAFGQHIPKGYIYFAMGFSLFVEALNLRAKKKDVPPVQLRPGNVPGERIQ
jgi:predicted tellurium resistance membrane protein TerC